MKFYKLQINILFTSVYRYYLGTHESKAGQRHLYVVHDPATDDSFRLEPQCLTCDLRFLEANRSIYSNCSHFSAHFSPLPPGGK